MRIHWFTTLALLSVAACNPTGKTVQLAVEGAQNAAPPPALQNVTSAQPAAHNMGAAGAAATNAPSPPLYTDLGTYHHAVTCSAPAQQYFDQGLRLVYGFNHDEAVRAFNEAGRLDPNCAMAFWGAALALGPNINLPLDADRARSAHDAVQHPVALAPRPTAAEQAYIAALAKRYSDDPNAERAGLDRAYADAMRQLAQSYPDDPDAATLFAEAMMDLRPWDLWSADGQPRPETPEIVATLE